MKPLLNEIVKLSEDCFRITETGSIHCYLLIGKTGALLIDTGYGYEDIRPFLRELTDRPITVVLTHGDSDHALGAGRFDEVWIHPLDYGKMKQNDTPERKRPMVEHRLKKMPELSSILDIASYIETPVLTDQTAIRFLQDGQIFDLGDRTVECIHTPGHSYGHMMFLEQPSGRLFAGDQLAQNHYIWHHLSADEQASFGVTLAALNKLKARADSIHQILPAHGASPADQPLIEDLYDALKYDLPKTWKNDSYIHTAMGDGYAHQYRSAWFYYNDARLEEYLGEPVHREKNSGSDKVKH
ncbi:MAG: MBL fold metallo-hydrolase [Solobacterium sp.]|nr:MBL fold metallo-hydrolase [Solobacterium sp.]